MSNVPQNDNTNKPNVSLNHADPHASNDANLDEDNFIKNGTPIATKRIDDIIEFQEPSTSKNYAFKTEIRINILEQPPSQRTINTEDSVSLTLFNENQRKEPMEAEESFVTIDTCIKEKTTNTTEPTMFSRNDRTQRMILVNSEAPPPYHSQPPPPYTGRPPQQSGYMYAVQDASRGDRYYINDGDPSYSDSFANQSIRHNFIRKVFLLLTVQLTITTGFILLATFHEPSKEFLKRNYAVLWIAMAFFMVIYVAVMCYQACRRVFPLNFILLFLITISMSYVCAGLTAFYSTKVVLVTVGSTALVCFLVTLLAFQTWLDITKWYFIITMATIVFLVFGIVIMILSFIFYSKVLWLVYSGLATVMFTVYLLYDMQCILGGRRHELSPEEYIAGALSLYVDIIMIFLYMLQLVNACSS